MAEDKGTPDPDEKISLSRRELQELLDERDRDAKMSDEERKFAGLIDRAVDRALDKRLPEKLSALFEPEGDDGKPGDDQKPGDAEKEPSLLDKFLGTDKK